MDRTPNPVSLISKVATILRNSEERMKKIAGKFNLGCQQYSAIKLPDSSCP